LKVEVMCSNEECATYGTNQLRRCKTTGIGLPPWWAYDQDGNVLECGLCGTALTVTRLSTEDAQFAAGSVEFTPKLADALGDKTVPRPAAPLEAAEKVRPFFRDHISGVAFLNDDQELVSDGVIGREKILIVTNPQRTKTIVMLHTEYAFIDW
jgi:hypothetical protein